MSLRSLFLLFTPVETSSLRCIDGVLMGELIRQITNYFVSVVKLSCLLKSGQPSFEGSEAKSWTKDFVQRPWFLKP